MRPIPVLLTLFQKKEKEKFGQFKKYVYLCTRKTKSDAPVAQLVEHLTLNQGVQGSSPCGCTRNKKGLVLSDAPVAQLVEHLTLNQGVQGSSPCGCTK